MNWLSREEIKRRAEESPKEALDVSIEHWEQICEFVEAKESVSGHYGWENCGLCWKNNPSQKRRSCPPCPLAEGGIGSCCQEWRDFRANQSLPNAQAMLNRLYQEKDKMLCKREIKKECKKEKPKAKDGNHVDDLKRNAEDLEEFEVDGQYDGVDGKTFRCNYNPHNGQLWMIIQSSSSYFTIEEATEIHQKLGVVIATAKRQGAKKGC